MKPTVTRLVHYHHEGLEPLAALIVKVNEDDTVNLTVFGEQGGFFGTIIGCKYSEKPENGCWSWPPKV